MFAVYTMNEIAVDRSRRSDGKRYAEASMEAAASGKRYSSALPSSIRPNEVTYVLPLRRSVALSPEDELNRYLSWLVTVVEHVIVVDGSPDEVWAATDLALPSSVQHLALDAAETGLNGKAAGVRTAMRRVPTPFVLIADDDVRYDAPALATVVSALADADIVLPQNFFEPLPWHAVLDEGRSLLARVCGGDWPGTLALRVDAYVRAGGYDANALFENLELVRTIEACGGVKRRLDDVFVRRRPPTTKHYAQQRIRQAYDEFARPSRLCIQLAIGPLLGIVVYRFGTRGVLLVALGIMCAAEVGRRRLGATAAFPFLASALAPLWVLERAATSWLALFWRLNGGVPYAGGRLLLAANSMRTLRRRRSL